MVTTIRKLLLQHIHINMRLYFSLLLAFCIGISAGAFTVNGLNAIQRDELSYYFKGFIQLIDTQKLESSELLKISLFENLKTAFILWVLGVTIIGIPFIYVVVGIKGFITGFTSGFIIKITGMRGVLFTLFAVLPKEIIIVPCIIALGVYGINFSLSIIRNKSIKHLSKDGLRSNFFAYCLVTLFF